MYKTHLRYEQLVIFAKRLIDLIYKKLQVVQQKELLWEREENFNTLQ